MRKVTISLPSSDGHQDVRMRCTEVGAVDSSRFLVMSMVLRETYRDRADVAETGRRRAR
jgi:hypothetical protein